MGAERVVVICGHGINDPLVSTLMLDYILRLQEEGPRRPTLFFTEEPGEDKPPPETLSEMERLGIQWHPLRYRIRGPQILQRLRNLMTICISSFRFARGGRKKMVVAFLSMPGSYASVLRSLGFHRFILVSFEPHSRYMLELGNWRKGSLKTRIAEWFERLQLRNADLVVAPTLAAVEHVRQSGSPARIIHQGVTIDLEANRRREDQRVRLRSELGLDGKVVVVYAGKFNGLYYSEADYVKFMEDTGRTDQRVHHLIITPAENEEVLVPLVAAADLRGRCTVIGPVPPQELPGYLSAADMGVLAVPPTPSQKYRTPVKSALYWAAGLPIIIPEGISDDWMLARDHDAGWVVPDLLHWDGEALRAWVERMAGPAADEVRARCIQVAREHRNTGRMVEILREALD